MDKMWLDSNLDLKIVAYKVLPTGIKEGFIEFIQASVIDYLQQQEGVGGALDRELLLKHLRTVGQPANEPQKYETKNQHENFIKSMAGFCVATCVLGIGDRHPGNVMVKDNGIFFHIDYGHILGNFKYKFGIKRERAPFLLTPDMAHVYTKTGREEEFKDLCVRAYIILRRNASRLMNLYIIMSSAGLPELSGIHDVGYLKNMLKLEKINEEDAGNYFIGLINQSKNEKFRLLDNMIHNLKHG
jgi:phosphatidylinositol kinase/protein kinase (PI-3  family)